MVRSDLCPDPASHKCAVLLSAFCAVLQCPLVFCAGGAVLCYVCTAVQGCMIG